MKQSNVRANRLEQTAFLYLRLSRDDGEESESNSIQNQEKLLRKIAKDDGYGTIVVYKDDGVSGTTMNRPDFIKMVKAIECGLGQAVYVKDSSRLGRNYREVGYYTEEFFPAHDIRFVSVSDGIDSEEGEDELGPFRNVMNEMYAKDISKKRRIVNKMKGTAGEPLSPPPYGYIKDPENPKRWVVEEEAAAVVRRIFQMSLDGYGINQIAIALDESGIVTPTHYWLAKGIKRTGMKSRKLRPTQWNHSTVAKVLSLQEYCGDVINFKTFSKSYKVKKRIVNDEENRAIFYSVHEAIIDRATWEKVQSKRGTRKRAAPKSPETSIFSGLLKCSDCGSNLNYHFNQRNPEIKYFNCARNNAGRGGCPSTHYIRLDFLEQTVLQEVHRLTRFASEYEEDFVKGIIGHSMNTVQSGRQQKQKELDALVARDKELDRLFERIYEDNVAGKISDERFAKMSGKYEQEQGDIKRRAKILRSELKKDTSMLYSADSFLEIVRQYTDAKELTQRMVNELISHIVVYHAERVSGEATQKIKIHYNCIGAFEVPNRKNIPALAVFIPTRKGVALSYANA